MESDRDENICNLKTAQSISDIIKKLGRYAT